MNWPRGFSDTWPIGDLVKIQVANYIYKSFSHVVYYPHAWLNRHVATVPGTIAMWLKSMFFCSEKIDSSNKLIK
jgi:hypothetical protein